MEEVNFYLTEIPLDKLVSVDINNAQRKTMRIFTTEHPLSMNDYLLKDAMTKVISSANRILDHENQDWRFGMDKNGLLAYSIKDHENESNTN